jgi:hypothetical protein
MNDQDIYNLVKDLSPTARPEGLVFEDGWVEANDLGNPDAKYTKAWMLEMDGVGLCNSETGEPDGEGEEWKGEEPQDVAVLIPAYHAQLMHEAALSRWLAERWSTLHFFDNQYRVSIDKRALGLDVAEGTPARQWTVAYDQPIQAMVDAYRRITKSTPTTPPT